MAEPDGVPSGAALRGSAPPLRRVVETEQRFVLALTRVVLLLDREVLGHHEVGERGALRALHDDEGGFLVVLRGGRGPVTGDRRRRRGVRRRGAFVGKCREGCAERDGQGDEGKDWFHRLFLFVIGRSESRRAPL